MARQASERAANRRDPVPVSAAVWGEVFSSHSLASLSAVRVVAVWAVAAVVLVPSVVAAQQNSHYFQIPVSDDQGELVLRSWTRPWEGYWRVVVNRSLWWELEVRKRLGYLGGCGSISVGQVLELLKKPSMSFKNVVFVQVIKYVNEILSEDIVSEQGNLLYI